MNSFSKAVICALIGGASAQPGSTTSGKTSATGCGDVTTCSLDGTSNYHLFSLTWSAGRFSGTIKSNLCPAHSSAWAPASADCSEFTIPAPDYSGDGPYETPSRGIVGLTINGVSIYGPMEAGFGTIYNAPNPCITGEGYCAPGVDVAACVDSLTHVCGGASNVQTSLFSDTCGGHANPYHYHENNACDYDATASGHSPLIGVALDGIGIYGLNEDTSTPPTDLDACNGHIGVVPADAANGIAGGTYYHYHVTSTAPHTIGCFAGAQAQAVSVATCRSITSNCGSGYVLLANAQGVNRCYDDDCSCFDSNELNTDITADSCDVTSSTPTTGTTPTPGTTPTTATTPSATTTDDDDDDESTRNIIIIVVVVGVVVLIIAIVAIYYFCCKEEATDVEKENHPDTTV